MGFGHDDGNDTTIVGGTTAAVIGNVGDRLKVDAAIAVGNSGDPGAFSKKLRYRDMNAGTGGIARGSSVGTGSWTTLFSRSGSGLLTGFTINGSTMTANWAIRLLIDAEEVFGSDGLATSDMNNINIYNLGNPQHNTTAQGLNVVVNSASFFFTSPSYAPIAYAESVDILVKGLFNSKTFNAGLIVLTEET